MTEPTPGFYSPGPNTVIGVNPLRELIDATLWSAVKGHRQIVAAIVNHSELDHLRREIRRQEGAGALVSGGGVGGAAGGAAGPAAG